MAQKYWTCISLYLIISALPSTVIKLVLTQFTRASDGWLQELQNMVTVPPSALLSGILAAHSDHVLHDFPLGADMGFSLRESAHVAPREALNRSSR